MHVYVYCTNVTVLVSGNFEAFVVDGRVLAGPAVVTKRGAYKAFLSGLVLAAGTVHDCMTLGKVNPIV